MHKTRSNRAFSGARPVAAQESRAVREAERDGVGGRQAGGFRRAVQADAESARELVQRREQKAAGAGAEVNDAGGRCAVGEGGERGLDQGLRFRARDQRGGGDGEVQAPELAPAEQVGERFVGGAAGNQGLVAGRIGEGVRIAQQGGDRDTQGVGQQQASLQPRVLDAGGTKNRGAVGILTSPAARERSRVTKHRG